MESPQEEILQIYLPSTAQTAKNSELCILDLFDQFFMIVIPHFNKTCKGIEFNQSTGSVCRNACFALRKLTHKGFGFASFVDAHGSDRKFMRTL